MVREYTVYKLTSSACTINSNIIYCKQETIKHITADEVNAIPVRFQSVVAL